MKLLALSDVHGDARWAQKMAEKAAEEKVDLVLLCGDITMGDDLESVEGLVGPFKEKNLEVAILPGNHEGLATTQFLVERYKIKNLHGYAWKFGDIGIFGCGYANIGIHQLTDKEFFNTLKRTHNYLKDVRKRIMVTHVHPDETKLGLGVFEGSAGVKKAVEELQPDVHLCGHVHETAGMEDIVGKTKVINVGKTGKIIEV